LAIIIRMYYDTRSSECQIWHISVAQINLLLYEEEE